MLKLPGERAVDFQGLRQNAPVSYSHLFPASFDIAVAMCVGLKLRREVIMMGGIMGRDRGTEIRQCRTPCIVWLGEGSLSCLNPGLQWSSGGFCFGSASQGHCTRAITSRSYRADLKWWLAPFSALSVDQHGRPYAASIKMYQV